MKVRILAAVALIAVIAGLLWLTAGFKADYEAAMEQYHQEVRSLEQLQEELNAVQRELEALNTDEADARDAAAWKMYGEAAAMEQETKQIQAQIEALSPTQEETNE